MLCSCKLRLRRASPTVGLPSAHRALLGLRRLYAGGAKTDSYKCPGRIAEFMLCSCKLRLRRASPTVDLPRAHRDDEQPEPYLRKVIKYSTTSTSSCSLINS